MNEIVNRHERELAQVMSSGGWETIHDGYPDFLFVKGDRLIAVEVKASRSHKLKSNQLKVLKLLCSYGIECYRWTAGSGFEPVTEHIDSLEKLDDYHINRQEFRRRRTERKRQIVGFQKWAERSFELK